ncbi:MAG: hypothetical protein ABF702_11525 [Lacticaseibacillus paracasei]
MNCCNHDSGHSNGDNQNGKKGHAGGHIGHLLMMALCCGAPLILLLVIPLLGTSLPGVKAVLLFILPFICPIMMIGMLPMMFMRRKHDDNHHQEIHVHEDEQLDVPEKKRLN